MIARGILVLALAGACNVGTAPLTSAVPHCGDPGGSCPASEPTDPNLGADADLRAQLQKVVDTCRVHQKPTAQAIWVKLRVGGGGKVSEVVSLRNSDDAPLAADLATCIRSAAQRLRTERRVARAFDMDYAAVERRPQEAARAALTTALGASMKTCQFDSPYLYVNLTVNPTAAPDEIVAGGLDLTPEAKVCIEAEMAKVRLSVDPARTSTALRVVIAAE